MKKTFILLILSFVLAAQQYSMGNSILSSETINDIPLRKDDVQPQPRTPTSVDITAAYDDENLIIDVSGYSGSVEVEIIGTGGFIDSFNVTNSATEYIDITSLQQGSYSLIITIQNGTQYIGEFEL